MWQYEHAADTDLPPAQVWAVLADLHTWASWDASMEWVRLDGELAVGARVVMKPVGSDPIFSTITRVDEDRCYADRTEFAGLVLLFSHTLHPMSSGRTRVVHRLEVTGGAVPAVEAQVGEGVSQDFPDAMQALLAMATQRGPSTRPAAGAHAAQ